MNTNQILDKSLDIQRQVVEIITALQKQVNGLEDRVSLLEREMAEIKDKINEIEAVPRKPIEIPHHYENSDGMP